MVFQAVHEVIGDGDIQVKKFKSTETGMTAVIGDVPGPIVNGYLIVATEAHDDDGIPHTLEHLCFMGSEEYPYTGVLDLLANRCLASGTNAWTDTDHTCYTMSTAGSEGFLQLLPVFLDHVLHPILTDAAFVTEVHHINGDGEDAGVVYCEMQGRENTGESRCHLQFLREMYPGRCGYKSETGGIMKNLRETLTNDKIRAFHREFYRPENLCVVVTGQVKEDEILSSLSAFEKRIIEKRQKVPAPNFTRPWEEPVPPLPGTVDTIVEFPCDDDDNGLVFVGWRGPSACTEFKTTIALSLLIEYLNDTAASPLQQAFVERQDPYCSSIEFCLIENSESCMYLSFAGVKKEKLSLVKDRLIGLLQDTANGTEPLNMKRMKDVIHRKKLQVLSTMESSPHFAIASAVIGDFLYGHGTEDLDIRLKTVPQFDFYESQPASFWTDILTKFFLGKPIVHVLGNPSPKLMEKMSEEEKERIRQQRDKLGEDGLAKKTELLKSSKNLNQTPAPPTILSKFYVPTTENISFHSVSRTTNDGESNSILLNRIPFRMQVDDLKTNFVTLRLLLNTSSLEPTQRLYLPLLCQLLTESAILRNGTLIPYEEVVTQLSAETITSSVSLGVDGQFTQLLTLSLKVERSQYARGIQWLKELLFDTQFIEERISVVVKRMLNDLALIKRKGGKVTSDLLRSVIYASDSNEWAAGSFRQSRFLQEVERKLQTSGIDVVKDLTHLRDAITGWENVFAHVALNISKVKEDTGLPDIIDPWLENFISATQRPYTLGKIMFTPITPSYNLIVPPGTVNGLIAGVGSVESNFMQQTVESLHNWTDSDIPALMVAIQYLTQMEGPMWKQIRGVGLSYHYNISLHIHEGMLFFLLFKASHVAAAYKESQAIVSRHVNGSEEWKESLLESCRASLVYELIERERSIPRVAIESLLNHLRGMDMSYMKDLVTKVSRVSVEDLKRVAPKYLTDLFDPIKTRRSVVCHPSKVAEVTQSFKE